MLGQNKNLKDTPKDSIKDTSFASTQLAPSWLDHPKAYTKTNKLITALYMVTDTMDKDEPIRLKLRTLGIEILSDINISQKGLLENLDEKISVILSFLNISSDIGMISEMNQNILKKEFLEFKQSISEFKTQNSAWLEEFISRPSDIEFSIGQYQSNGQLSKFLNKGQSTRIGVQKGSTLLKALSEVERLKALNKIGEKENFGTLKSKRREEIIAIIKDKKNTSGIDGATITDIKNGAKELLVSCGEKTLQRELVSMVKDNILYRKGSKRWSQYFLQ